MGAPNAELTVPTKDGVTAETNTTNVETGTSSILSEVEVAVETMVEKVETAVESMVEKVETAIEGEKSPEA